ncbi:hypothetical protein [Marinoscillum sp.]|uniref:hypothetical protein n=1 Tax=Marinoscillum sp. TaxID=2024838 RepID=UPI003BACE89D
MNMWLTLFVTLGLFTNPQQDYKTIDYVIAFYRIDNQVDIIVNDSLVYTTGVIDHNPDFKGEFTYYIGNHLTDQEDQVTVRLYNGRPPYDIKDKHWEIEYVLKKNGKEFDYMWDEGDNNEVGLVFEEKYLL